jgi:hypothetical protein
MNKPPKPKTKEQQMNFGILKSSEHLAKLRTSNKDQTPIARKNK